MIQCTNCGANTRFDIASQKMLCPFCGTYSEPTDEKYENAAGADMQTVTGDYAGRPDMMQVKIYTCSQCGGELMSTDNDATAFCSYCGTHQILQERLDVKKRPDHIIPFKITKDQCKDVYAKKLKKMLFAPKALKDPAHIEEFRGIYMPYWFYNFTQKGTISLDGTKEHRSGNYRIIDHYNLKVDADNYYGGISHDASTSFDDNISEALAPYNVGDTLNFRTAYLSGFYADIPDTDPKTYERDSAIIAADDGFDEASHTQGFGGYSITNKDENYRIKKTHTTLQSSSSAMFPVWFLAYRMKDRVAYAAINGQTGKMTADIPVDGKKYLITTAILTVIIWGILQVTNISSLRGILMTVIMASMFGGLVYGMVLEKLSTGEKLHKWELDMAERIRYNAQIEEEEAAAAADPEAAAQAEEEAKAAAKASGKKEKSWEKNVSKKKVKKGLSAKKPSTGLGLAGMLIMYAIMAVAILITTYIGYGFIMLIAPIVMAVYANLSLGDLGVKRGKLSNWVLMGVMELSMIVWLANPYKDPVYYVCCLLMTGCVVWCFFDVLYYYNQLMTRPLPQFNKQGGDDRA